MTLPGPRCPDHHHREPCPMCRSEHLADHATPRPGCPWCPKPETAPDARMAAANDQEAS